ncbi:hypothetical protein BraRD5C2_55470 [Bradyrhizobium sp. RD5-C2]|nr:hypothetical protein BraRD5C2_55470 [Bradyrhizobium sp. RD5-C2]
MTKFAGFPFGRDEPFSYLQGKRVLELAMDSLRQRSDLRKQLKMDPKASGRPAITGSQGDAVWDFLSLAPPDDVKHFTNYPHLTLGVLAREVEATMTIPNAVNGTMRRNLVALGQDKFKQHIGEVVKNLGPLLRKHPRAIPSFRGVQRRYPSQRSEPFVDARIDFDLRTAVARKRSAKLQPLWIAAAYEAFVHKQGSNYQMQIGVRFRYDRCELRTAKALDAVAGAWLACKPIVDLAR